MFGLIYGMLGGDHEELPRRRRADPAITFDRASGTFMAEDGADREPSTWLGRGEVPGAPAAEPLEHEGLSVHEEMQRLARRAATP